MTKPGLVQMHGILVFLHKFHRLYLLPYNFIFFSEKQQILANYEVTLTWR